MDYSIPMERLKVKFTEVEKFRRKFIRLNFYDDEELVFYQNECSEWSREKLVNIYKYIKELKSDPIYLDWIKYVPESPPIS